MKQGTLTLPDHVKGTTFAVLNFTVEVGGVAPTSDLADVSIVFEKDGVPTIVMPSAITDANAWKFTVGPATAEAMDVEVGTHTFDIRTIDLTGDVQKYVKGTIKIEPSPQ